VQEDWDGIRDESGSSGWKRGKRAGFLNHNQRIERLVGPTRANKNRKIYGRRAVTLTELYVTLLGVLFRYVN